MEMINLEGESVAHNQEKTRQIDNVVHVNYQFTIQVPKSLSVTFFL